MSVIHLTYPTHALNGNEFFSLWADIQKLDPQGGNDKAVDVDLRPVEYVSEVGASFIGLTIEYVRMMGFQPVVHLPLSKRAVDYFRHVGLLDFLAKHFAIAENKERTDPRRILIRNGNGEWSNEQMHSLHKFSLPKFGVVEKNKIHESLLRELDGMSEFGSVFARSLYITFYELTCNVVQHSNQPIGTFAIHNYSGLGKLHRKERYCRMTVSDLGIGIKQSFRNYGRYAGFENGEDSDYIALALSSDISGTGLPGRGNGLFMVRKCSTRTVISSGYGFVQATPTGLKKKQNTLYNPGTSVSLELPLPSKGTHYLF